MPAPTEKYADAMATHHNRLGFRGVEYDKHKRLFRAKIGNYRKGTRKHLGYFDTAEEAAQAYDEAARERYGSIAYMNFPLKGENKVRKGDGVILCPRGHKYSEYGYYCSATDRTNCRKCNALAQARRKIRRKK